MEEEMLSTISKLSHMKLYFINKVIFKNYYPDGHGSTHRQSQN